MILASNWVIGLILLAIGVLKVLWGLDLMAAALVTHGRQVAMLARDGAFWLGTHFAGSGLIVYSALGLVLLNEPLAQVPLWFALPSVIIGIEAGLAWKFLAGDRRLP